MWPRAWQGVSKYRYLICHVRYLDISAPSHFGPQLTGHLGPRHFEPLYRENICIYIYDTSLYISDFQRIWIINDTRQETFEKLQNHARKFILFMRKIWIMPISKKIISMMLNTSRQSKCCIFVRTHAKIIRSHKMCISSCKQGNVYLETNFIKEQSYTKSSLQIDDAIHFVLR